MTHNAGVTPMQLWFTKRKYSCLNIPGMPPRQEKTAALAPPPGTDPEAHLAGLGIEVLHLAVPDTSGTLRQKRFRLPRAAGLIRDGWSFIEAMQWWGSGDRAPEDRGWRHAPAQVDLTSLRRLPFEPAAAVALADFTGPAGELSARRALARLVDRAAAALAAANRCWSGLTMASHADLLRDLDGTLAVGDVHLDHLCAELGPGCLELATSPRDPLTAAGDLAFLKVYTRAWCHRAVSR
jgi:glutamine synthetase